MFTQPNDELLTTRAVMAMTGFKSRTTLYRRVKLNRFPQPCEIGANQIRWRASDIRDWINSLPARRY